MIYASSLRDMTLGIPVAIRILSAFPRTSPELHLERVAEMELIFVAKAFRHLRN